MVEAAQVREVELGGDERAQQPRGVPQQRPVASAHELVVAALEEAVSVRREEILLKTWNLRVQKII